MSEVESITEEEYAKVRMEWCHAFVLLQYSEGVGAPAEAIAILKAHKAEKEEAFAATRHRIPKDAQWKPVNWLEDVASVLVNSIPHLHGEPVRVRIEADWFPSVRGSGTEMVVHTKSLLSAQAHPSFRTRVGGEDVPVSVSFVDYVPEE